MSDQENLSRSTVSEEPSSDFSKEVKRKRVLAFLQDHALDGVLLTLQQNFAWYTDGGRSYVNVGTEESIADLLITPSGDHLFSNSTENIRLATEEIPWKVDHAHLSPWWEDGARTRNIGSEFGDRIGSDAGPLRREFSRLRYSLLPNEVERYRKLGTDTAAAFWDLARFLRTGMTERDLAAELSAQLIRKGMFPLVMLVAFDARASSYRHPLPTDNKLKNLALVSVCARRYGLIVSVSRAFSLGPVPDELLKKHRAVAALDAWLIGKTTPGRRIPDLFEGLKEQYAEVGFANEWQLHHQGGATGYATRDYRATSTSDEVVQDNQAFAWNPSITGAKSEDTILAVSGGIEILTADPRWPTMEVEVKGANVLRPDIFVLD
ncbi:MAG: M24 family metallopeptidase [Bacteroidota bacterium]